MLCIEVKLLSEKSRSGDRDQLMDYTLSLDDRVNRKTYQNSKIAFFEGVFLARFYLTYFSQHAEVHESLEEIRKKGKIGFESRIFELRWNDITKTLSNIKSDNNYEHALIHDLVLLLKKKNFVDFTGFSDITFDINYSPLFDPPLLKPKRPQSLFFRFQGPRFSRYRQLYKRIFLEVNS